MESSEKLEFQKAELSLDVNAFDKPTELTGPKAWTQLILNLLYLVPGTYPSLPDMGIGIQRFEYDFLDEACDQIQTGLENQIRTYLSDLPVTNIDVNSTDLSGGGKALMIKVVFEYGGNTDMAVIAVNADTDTHRFLNFEVGITQ